MSNMMVNASKYSYLSISKAPFQGRRISRLPYWYASCIMIVSYVFADSQTYILLNSDLSSYLSSPRVVNIIRYVKGSRNTACGHNDFCSVRLNGPI